MILLQAQIDRKKVLLLKENVNILPEEEFLTHLKNIEETQINQTSDYETLKRCVLVLC